MTLKTPIAIAAALALAACGGASSDNGSNEVSPQSSAEGNVFTAQSTLEYMLGTFAEADQRTATYATPANCGPGSNPETGIQGRVPIEERENGRSLEGYSCNMKLVGQYQGEGTSWVNQSYKNCAYNSQSLGLLPRATPGVHAIDVSDPSNPKLSKVLDSVAFRASTWESMKVNEKRGLLAGVAVGPGLAAGFFDVYDISKDCAQPELLNSLAGPLTIPSNVLGHEGAWSPDGNTYWATSLYPGAVTAIDTTDPSNPSVLMSTIATPSNHGFELSEDGNRMYMTSLNPPGVVILDTSSVQNREPLPMLTEIGSVFWGDGSTSQHTIPVSYNGKPYLVAVDEGGAGAARFIDITDETKPFVASAVKLDIHRPEYADLRAVDTAGEGAFGYEGHYCGVDSKVNPTALACGYFQSGVRVFDVRNPLQPSEIAYFNPPAQALNKDKLRGSEHANSAIGQNAPLKVDWCSSPPRFVDGQIWVACQDNGFMVLEFTNNAYPLSE